MRLLISFMATVALAALLSAFAFHNVRATPAIALSAAQEESGDGARRISPADAHAAFDRGRAVIVDVRSIEAYRESHIKGALSIPLDELESRLSELPRNKTIITYCT
jgi:predicted sulfurtransferase